MCVGAGQRVGEAAAIALACSVDAPIVDAEVLAEAVDEVGCEDLVGDACYGIRGPLPVTLYLVSNKFFLFAGGLRLPRLLQARQQCGLGSGYGCQTGPDHAAWLGFRRSRGRK